MYHKQQLQSTERHYTVVIDTNEIQRVCQHGVISVQFGSERQLQASRLAHVRDAVIPN